MIYKKLKQMSGYYNFSQRTTVGTFLDEIKEQGLSGAFSDRKMWNQMRMSDRDLSDVTGYTYTFLMNGKNPATQFKALFKKGEKIRLRFVNSSAMTFFDVRIPGLKMTVVAADGNHVKPVSIDEFRIGVAETYDVIVQPKSHKAYAIFAQSIDRSGYAMGSLTPKVSLLAKAPRMDPAGILTHTDMGMDMGKMDQGGGMKMAKKKSKYAAMEAQKYPITKLPMKRGVQTTMMAMSPKYRLDDPGVGLRNNGRKVLTYADLKNRYSTANAKRPDREIILHLTGNMERYMWSINGIKYADSQPMQFHYGERLRITFINDTMMNHPMHLHGMWSDLETGDDKRLVRKHTIVVQPGAKISYRVTVDARGTWAYHCHMLYHMAGMFRKVVVSLIMMVRLGQTAQASMEDDLLLSMFIMDKFELLNNDENTRALEGSFWVGYDINKLYIYSEGEATSDGLERSQNELVYSRAIAPFWDAQIGLAYDKNDDVSKAWAVIAISGLAPYYFEIRAALLVNGDGNVGLRLDLEYESLLTQKLILAPSLEADFYTKDDAQMRIGAGLSSIDAGLRSLIP